jgi:hypothetical protein
MRFGRTQLSTLRSKSQRISKPAILAQVGIAKVIRKPSGCDQGPIPAGLLARKGGKGESKSSVTSRLGPLHRRVMRHTPRRQASRERPGTLRGRARARPRPA